MSHLCTADLCDKYHPHEIDQVVPNAQIQILPPLFRDYGGKPRFSGQAATIKCFENNPLVRKAVMSAGNGRVLVVDGGGSLRCALMGDMLANLAIKNGWAGIIINGAIRDSEVIGGMALGVKAIATIPIKSSKRDPGVEGVPVVIGGCTIRPGDFVYADGDGVIVSPTELTLP